jgi:hypothetical protein
MLSIPTLEKNDKTFSLNLTEENFKDFNDIIKSNPGLTSKEYIKLMTFYQFTDETINYAFKFFNTYKNTFYNICGPFLLNNGKWKLYDLNKNIFNSKLSLEIENKKLREEILLLKNKLKIE